MGMFDSVWVPCPKCNTPSEFQSKSGECRLESYDLKDCPDDVLAGVNRHAPNTCADCGTKFWVKLQINAVPEIWNDEKNKGEIMNAELRSAIETAIREAKDQYALAYLHAIPRAIREGGEHGLKVQLLYVLSNLSTWRGENAKKVKAVFKKYTK